MMDQKRNDIVIVIEAGHRKNTPGKKSPNGVFREWEWNEDCKNIVFETLSRHGFDVYDVTPEGDDDNLAARVSAVNGICARYGKDKVIYISIHCNAAGNGEWMSARKWSVWTTKGKTKSDELAERMYEAAVDKWGKDKVRTDVSDGDHDYESNFYVLQNSKCPAVLIENFFYDNKEDYEYLCSPMSLYDCAEVIVNGVINYMGGA